MAIINRPDQKRLRQTLRNNPTPWERKLWRYLSKSQLSGYKFRRQYGIDKYVVDFYCPQIKLIIELDGGGHFSERLKKSDKARQLEIESSGYHILRYTNDEIDRNISGVLENLKQHCTRLKSRQ